MRLTAFLFAILVCSATYALDAPQLKIGPEWNDNTKKELYFAKSSASSLAKAFSLVTDQTPLSIAWNIHFMNFDQELLANQIGTDCKNAFSKNSWSQISCISHEINLKFEKLKFQDYLTKCQAYAWAFKLAFEKLEIPGASAGLEDGSTSAGGHVINRITLTTKDGGFVSYATDAQWAPGVLFPLTRMTLRYHDPSGSGHATNLALPRLKVPQENTTEAGVYGNESECNCSQDLQYRKTLEKQFQDLQDIIKKIGDQNR